VFEPTRKDLASVREDFLVGVIMLVMRVEGEDPLSPNSRGLESGAREASC
jgi:hypothetical protein